MTDINVSVDQRPGVASMGEAARWYAAYGWYVIPLHTPQVDERGQLSGCSCESRAGHKCPHPGKHPRIRDWENQATTDMGQIDRWWSKWPDANIGIAAGPSGLVVVDMDTYKEAAGEGDMAIVDSVTVTSLTGGGGQHLIYQHPADGPAIRNDDKALPAWVNIRAHGGQFVAPPSLHASGRRYAWEDCYHPRDMAPQPLPARLRALLQPTRGTERRAVDQRQAAPVTGRIADGGRNNTLTSIAGTMRRRGLSEAAIDAALQQVNAEQCDPPLPVAEVQAIAKSVAHYAAPATSYAPGVVTGQPPARLAISPPNGNTGRELKIGDVVENEYGFPIRIVDYGDGYYLGPHGGEWVLGDDGKLISYRPPVHAATPHNEEAAGSGPAAGYLPPSSAPRPMRDLLAHQFKPQEYLVDGLIAKGHLGILGGRPKSGKSWLGLQLAMCIDTGADFLGRETTKAKVLYYALEDGARRVQARAKLIDWQPERAAVLFTIPYLDDGQGGHGPGAVEVDTYANDYDLIIIDTLIASMSGRTDERDNSAMGNLVNTLAYIAHEKDVAIVIVHHTGKAANPDDIFSTIRGASAIRGAYDMGLILERKPGEREAILHAESRDLDIRNMTLRQADEGAGWVYVGDAHELEKIRAGRKVLEVMLENDTEGGGMTAKQLAEIRKVSEATIGRQLQRLEADGYIYRKEQAEATMGRRPELWAVGEEFR